MQEKEEGSNSSLVFIAKHVRNLKESHVRGQISYMDCADKDSGALESMEQLIKMVTLELAH